MNTDRQRDKLETIESPIRMAKFALLQIETQRSCDKMVSTQSYVTLENPVRW